MKTKTKTIPVLDISESEYHVTEANKGRAEAAEHGLRAYLWAKGEAVVDTDTLRDFLQDILHWLAQQKESDGATPEDILRFQVERAIEDFPHEFGEEGEEGVNHRCQCDCLGSIPPGMEILYEPEELMYANHQPGACRWTKTKLYQRGTRKLWLCSCCSFPSSDVLVEDLP